MEQVKKLTELAQKIMQVDDTKRKYEAAANLQQKIVEDIGSVILACTDLIGENTTLRFSNYQSNINTARKCINLLDYNEVVEYESDTEEKRAERKQKLEEYRQITSIQLPPKKVIHHMGVECYTEVIRDVSPDVIYCQHGIYRQYSEVCNTFEYRLCRRIQKNSNDELKTLFQKVCLYIALKNERAMMREELLLLGIDLPDNKEAASKQGMADLKQCANVKPHYNNSDAQQANKQYKALVKSGYLPSITPLNDWLFIYGANGANSYSEPLEWQKTQSELGYLVQCIWGDTDPQRLWAVCEDVFTIKGKKPNTQTMKSKLSSISNGYTNRPKSFDALDKALRV